ncbi:MAG: family 78 glycoside hydrolase catalytic domain [Clostridia bacterium]|nr:family 78 glycoside hydrolase catalytic domain [Clostridia bacterium]
MSHNFKGIWITDDEFANLKARDVLFRGLGYLKLDCSQHRNRHILFRKKFVLEKSGKSTMFITADDYYKLYINGIFVTQGPAPCYHNNYNYNVVDVSQYLHEGENLIAVHTLYQGLYNKLWQSGDNRHGLIFDLEVDGKCVVCSDESVVTKPHDGFSETHTVGYDTQFMEKQDSRASCFGFEKWDFDDSDWANASKNNVTDHVLAEQKTKSLVFERKEPVISEMRANTLFLDFGSVYVGYLCMKAKGKDGDEIVIKCGQELNDDGSVRYNMRAYCKYIEPWVLSGNEDTLEQFDYKAFRYAEIDIPEGAEISDIYFNIRHYPFTLVRGLKEEYRGNKQIESIWKLCVNTMHYAVQEVIQDCCEREKAFYVGDGCYTALTHHILSGDDSMVRKLIDDAFFSSFINEGLVICPDCSRVFEIAEYSIMLTYLVLWHYRLTGDREYLLQNYPKCVKLMEFYRNNYENNNLINVNDKWNVVEWPDNYRDGYDVDLNPAKPCPTAHVVMNAHYHEAINCVNKMAKILKVEPYRDTKELYEAFLDAFYDREKHVFRDSVVSDHVSIVGNFYCYGFDLCPDDECREKILTILRERKISSIALFTYFPTLMGLVRNGKWDDLKECLLDEGAWLRMISEGATMSFEGWGKDTKYNTSLCHLTTAAVAPFLADIDQKKLFE